MSSTAAIHTEIAETLRAYIDAVPRQKEPNPPDLMALFDRLDALEQQIRREPATSPELKHYMFQKSYRKAYNLLLGNDGENENGDCRR